MRRRWTTVVVMLALLAGTVSCGTILYPERRGQRSGRIDAGVAVLDGIGLLFFIVPGAVAFGVDFATGAIFLPSGRAGLEIVPGDLESADVVAAGRSPLTRQRLEHLLALQTGRDMDLAAPGIRAARASGGADLEWHAVEEVMTPEQYACFHGGMPAAVQ
jgi:hypothetical protein